MLSLALASCHTRQAMVENVRAHRRGRPKSAPAFAAVVMVAGPINAAEITDQKSIFRSLLLMAQNLPYPFGNHETACQIQQDLWYNPDRLSQYFLNNFLPDKCWYFQILT